MLARCRYLLLSVAVFWGAAFAERRLVSWARAFWEQAPRWGERRGQDWGERWGQNWGERWGQGWGRRAFAA